MRPVFKALKAGAKTLGQQDVQLVRSNLCRLSATLTSQSDAKEDSKFTWQAICRLAGCASAVLATTSLSHADADPHQDLEPPREPDGAAPTNIVANESTAKFQVFTQTALSNLKKGDVKGAEKFMKHALEEARAGFGERDGHVGAALQNLAELYRANKELDRAEQLYKEALDILKNAYGELDYRFVHAHTSLGLLYYTRGRYEDARAIYRQSLKALLASKGRSHRMYADMLVLNATFENKVGQIQDSRALFHEAISVYESLGPSYYLEPLKLELIVARDAAKAGDSKSAIELFRQAFKRADTIDKLPQELSAMMAQGKEYVADKLIMLGEGQEALDLLYQIVQSDTKRISDVRMAGLLCKIGEQEIKNNRGDKAAYIRANNLADRALEASGRIWKHALHASKKEGIIAGAVQSFSDWFTGEAAAPVQPVPADLAHVYCSASLLSAEAQAGLQNVPEAVAALRKCFELLEGVTLESSATCTLNAETRANEGVSSADILYCQLLIRPLFLYLQLSGPDETSTGLLHQIEARLEPIIRKTVAANPSNDIANRLRMYQQTLNEIAREGSSKRHLDASERAVHG